MKIFCGGRIAFQKLTSPRCRVCRVNCELWAVYWWNSTSVPSGSWHQNCQVSSQPFFLGFHFHAALDQGVPHRVKVIHFQAEMMDALAAGGFRRAGLEDFDEMIRVDLEIKSKQLAVLHEIKMPAQAERPAIEIQAAVQIL